MEEAQRTRILEAMAEAMAERGAGAATVGIDDLLARSGVSNAAFHAAFADLDACLLAMFDLGLRRVQGRVLAAYDGEPRWLDAIKAALAEFLRFLTQEPALGRVLVVHSASGGKQLLQARAQVLRTLADVVDRGRLEGRAGRQPPPPVVAEGVVGAVLAIVQNRLLSAGQSDMTDLFGSLVSIIVLPYLGAGVARRELTRPAPRARAGRWVGDARVERSGNRIDTIRLTYRTARVLGAIADYPGASNREVADRAGIVDQGQISKLLARLERRRLIEKLGSGRTRGAPNSWALTEHGEQVLKSVTVASRS
jgi:AcrR family transcriptional regulator/DNA-binding MarR family transcriptional regulator